jgi:hypothetical protein
MVKFISHLTTEHVLEDNNGKEDIKNQVRKDNSENQVKREPSDYDVVSQLKKTKNLTLCTIFLYNV